MKVVRHHRGIIGDSARSIAREASRHIVRPDHRLIVEIAASSRPYGNIWFARSLKPTRLPRWINTARFVSATSRPFSCISRHSLSFPRKLRNSLLDSNVELKAGSSFPPWWHANWGVHFGTLTAQRSPSIINVHRVRWSSAKNVAIKNCPRRDLKRKSACVEKKLKKVKFFVK
jgi:hypothetical protein